MKEKQLNILELMNYLPEEYKSYYWRVLRLDCWYHVGKINIQAFEEAARYGGGLSILWEDLRGLINDFLNVIDFVLVGNRNEEMFDKLESKQDRSYEEDEEIIQASDFALEIDDGEVLVVRANDKKLSKQIRKKFGPFPTQVEGNIRGPAEPL